MYGAKGVDACGMIVFRNLSKLMTPAKEAVLLARKLQDKGLIARTLCSVGEVEASVGKWDAALAAVAEAAVLGRQVGARATESRTTPPGRRGSPESMDP
eukprot:g29320.t1